MNAETSLSVTRYLKLLLIASLSMPSLQSAEGVALVDLIRESDLILVGTVTDEARSEDRITMMIESERELKGFGPRNRVLAASLVSPVPLANARGSETLILSRDREGAVVRNYYGLETGLDVSGRSAQLIGRRGLWFLQRSSDGGYRIRSVDAQNDGPTSAFYRIPPGSVRDPFRYTRGMPVTEKVLMEIASATEFYAGARGLGDRLLGATAGLSYDDTRMVFERFARSPYAALRAAGLAGLVRNGDVDALIRAEDEWNEFGRAYARLSLLQSIYDFRTTDPTAVNALGRLAANCSSNMYLRHAAAFALSRTAAIEATPYLAALLLSPVEPLRQAAANGLSRFMAETENETHLQTAAQAVLIATMGPAAIRKQPAAATRSVPRARRFPS